MDEPTPIIKGSCRCGLITYSCTTLPQCLTNCYCTTCQSLSGTAFLTFGCIPSSSFTWTSPLSSEDLTNSSKSSSLKTNSSEIAERTHCTDCGSPLTMQYTPTKEKIYITMGTVVEGETKELTVERHIFVAEKPGWFTLPAEWDNRFDEFP